MRLGMSIALLGAAWLPQAHADLLVGGDNQVSSYSEAIGAFP